MTEEQVFAIRLRRWMMVAWGISYISVPKPLHADPLVMTQAMKATTIAEILVERQAVRVELEIGAEDLPAFRNILPDDVYQQLGNEPVPLAERTRRFFQQDFTIAADEFGPLPGRITRFERRRRVPRDEITGDPLPANSDGQETVVFAELVFALDLQPDTLLIKPPNGGDDPAVSANVGFVAYHLGLPVNDFRYLAREEKLELDWEDPWYSFFHNRNLGRRYNAPASVFLYVDHFEVRKEIVIRPRDLQHWVDLGLTGKTKISAEQRADVERRAAAFLIEHGPVTIDGQAAEPKLDRVHFVQQSLRRTSIIEPNKDLDVASAMLGVIIVYRIDGLPQNVAMTWDLFGQKIKDLPAVAVDEAGAMPGTLTPQTPDLRWHNFLTNPTVPAFMEIVPPPRPTRVSISGVAVACLVVAVAVWLAWIRKDESSRSPILGPVAASSILVVMAVTAARLDFLRYTFAGRDAPVISDEAAADVTGSLLHNVYRAFDYRDEEVIYDVLDRSVAGELLARLYLELQKSLTVASQGGARMKVDDVELLACETGPVQHDTGFVATCEWVVTGTVGHWGHFHRRKNRYRAELVVRPGDARWKVHDVRFLNEQRVF